MIAMDTRVYNDLSIIVSKCFLKFSGVWFSASRADEIRRKIALFQLAVMTMYGVWVNGMGIHNFWGSDMSYCAFCIANLMFAVMAVAKVIVMRVHNFDLKAIVTHAERHFWHYNYDPSEQLHFAQCQKLCKLWIYFVLCIPGFILCGYCSTPIASNIANNQSGRELLFRLDWKQRSDLETPYYELLFAYQVVVVVIIFFAYLCTDVFLCVLNLHAICQFRILQYRMSHFWKADVKITDGTEYGAHCYAELKKCIQQHQLLIEFCDKLELVFKFIIFCHIVLFSVAMSLDCYQILLAHVSTLKRVVFTFHMIGSFIHLAIFSYTCHGLMEESTNITATLYFGSWTILPMNKYGKTLRSNIRIMMMRSLRPCCLTAGGFFPVTLETFTTLASSTFSYFTLLRESILRDEKE